MKKITIFDSFEKTQGTKKKIESRASIKLKSLICGKTVSTAWECKNKKQKVTIDITKLAKRYPIYDLPILL
ncbi:MAG: hypothetical protein QXI58_06310 [Candidatus Micrarchaeia archaeon]